MKNERGDYLTPRCNLSNLRRNAAVFEVGHVAQVLGAFTRDRSRRSISTLSIEELPKRERRINPPLSEADVAGLVRTIKREEARAAIAKLLGEAVSYESMAQDCRRRADKLKEMMIP